MIDTNELNNLTVEELRAGIALQRKEIDRLREEIKQVAEYNEGLTTRCIEDTSRIAALEQQLASRGGVPELEPYDAGLLNDFGGGDVNWWWDYIRAELARAHDFYQSQLAAASTEGQAEQADCKYPSCACVGGTTSTCATPPPCPRDGGEREAFESAMWGRYEKALWWDMRRESVFRLDQSGDYTNEFLRTRWEGWQARAATASQPAGDVCAHNWHDYGKVNQVWCNRCDALAARGFEEAPYGKLAAIAAQQQEGRGDE